MDVNKKLTDCKTGWTNTEVRAPTRGPEAVDQDRPDLHLHAPRGPGGAQGYYWTAIDYCNGKTVWSKYAGSGLTFNNNYAGLALGPDGTAYLGVIGGIIALRDGA